MGAKIGIINGFDKCFDFNFKADTLIFLPQIHEFSSIFWCNELPRGRDIEVSKQC